MEKQTHIPNQRPNIGDYESPRDFIAAMIAYLKATQRNFSILSATKSLRKVSPTLVSLIVKGQRQLTDQWGIGLQYRNARLPGLFGADQEQRIDECLGRAWLLPLLSV